MSGKTKLIKRAKADLESVYGIKTYTLPEAASELMSAGFDPNEKEQFQSTLYKLQKFKEDCLSESITGNSILLIDRGIADGKCYISETAFKKIMQSQNDNEKSIINRYDAIIQLQTFCVFDGVEVERQSNPNRVETSKQEVFILEKRIAEVYKNHPFYNFIPADSNIECKYKRLLNVILQNHKLFCSDITDD